MRRRTHPAGTFAGGLASGRTHLKRGDLQLEENAWASNKDPRRLSLYQRLLLAITNARFLSEVKRIHGRMITSNFISKSVLACRLVYRYFSFCRMEDAEKVFDQLPKRGVYCFNYMIKGYIDVNAYRDCLRLWERLISEKMVPDQHTLSLILMAYAGLNEVQQGKVIHGHVLQKGLVSDCLLMTSLLGLYSKCSSVGEARMLFDEMSQRDVFTWTVMIDGYVRARMYGKAFQCFSRMEDAGINANLVTWNALIGGFVRQGLTMDAILHFRRMQEVRIMPDKVSLCVILSGCAHSALLKFGRESHAFVLRKGFKTDRFLISALIDMYAKCGCLEAASYLFNQSEERDIGMWNAMLAGYEIHGKCKEALEIFSQMQEESVVKPNHITFSSLLSACSGTGMVDEGHECLNAMIRDCKIIPRRKDFVRMVNMFGRIGRLEFIENMPIEPSHYVWRALLDVFRVHQDGELGDVAAHQLCSCEGVKNEVHHIAMSNIYKDTGKWEDNNKMERRRRDERLEKKKCFSWIEVEKCMHVFYDGDSTPQSEQIYGAVRALEAVSSLQISCISKDLHMLGNPSTESLELEVHQLNHHTKS